MNDPDHHLAKLLRDTPAPPIALDPERRQAVVAAARQAWFRQRARQRHHLVWLAAAAVLAAAIAGWTLRILTEEPLVQAPVVARREVPPAPAARSAPAERPDTATATAKPALAAGRPASDVASDAVAKTDRLSEPLLMPAAPAAVRPATAMRAPAVPAAEQHLDAEKLGPANAALALGAEAGPDLDGSRGPAAAAADLEAAAPAAAPAPAAFAAKPAGPTRKATSTSERGRLVLARLALDADVAGKLPAADRQAALQAALDGLAGLDGPEAESLRSLLAARLRR